MATPHGSRRDPVLVRQLDRAGRRHAVVGAVLRLAVVLALVLSLYFLIPAEGFNQENPAGAWIRLAGVGLVFLTAMVIQVRIIVTADVPQIRAAEAVVESVVLILCLFALLYASMSATDAASFTEPLSKVDALYFTTATFATVGFGDISPVTEMARGIVSVQMIFGLGALVAVARVAFYAAGKSLRQ